MTNAAVWERQLYFFKNNSPKDYHVLHTFPHKCLHFSERLISSTIFHHHLKTPDKTVTMKGTGLVFIVLETSVLSCFCFHLVFHWLVHKSYARLCENEHHFPCMQNAMVKGSWEGHVLWVWWGLFKAQLHLPYNLIKSQCLRESVYLAEVSGMIWHAKCMYHLQQLTRYGHCNDPNSMKQRYLSFWSEQRSVIFSLGLIYWCIYGQYCP